VNLALSLANERDTEVLLIDADFAKPEILSTLGLEAGPGIIDAIADPAIDVESCVIRTDLPGLSVLPAGRASNEATEMLASDRGRAVLEQLAAAPSRILILDSAPALAASSASVLAFHAGQALLVVRADQTSEADLREAITLLGGCGHIRLLLNGVEFAASGRRFGSYYGNGA
jgi:Mrp family chromosome partitioning ATPase